MKQRVSEGEVTVEGSDDILTKVLGSPEHRGRVRGQGRFVKQSTYFHLPRQKKTCRTIEERIQEGIQKFMKEETERIVEKRDAFWAAEFQKLKAGIGGKLIETGLSPNIGSQQGSCSKGAHDILKDFDLQGVKKKLDLIQNVGIGKETHIEEHIQEKPLVDGEEHIQEHGEALKVVDVEDNQMLVEDVCLEPNNEEVLEVKGCTEWELAIGSPTNIVAYATVDTKCQVLHGKQLEKENVRVSITRVLQGSEKIPFPIQDEIVTVEQAVGTYIAWPRNLIMEVKTSAAAVKGSPKVKFSLYIYASIFLNLVI